MDDKFVVVVSDSHNRIVVVGVFDTESLAESVMGAIQSARPGLDYFVQAVTDPLEFIGGDDLDAALGAARGV